MSMSAVDLLQSLNEGGKLRSYWKQSLFGARKRVHTLTDKDGKNIGVQMSAIYPLLKDKKLIAIRWSGDIDEYMVANK